MFRWSFFIPSSRDNNRLCFCIREHKQFMLVYNQEEHMGWIIALIVGGIAGWLASMVMGRDASMGVFWNIVVGIIGSVIGNFVGGYFGFGGSIQEFSIIGLFTAFVGAVVLLLILNLIQRGRVR
ncbi:transglycosylase [Sphingorhabdus sp. SMR4y]|nr:transglycosylase [Sphingorhabdus sp. SMR4y]